jgi:hypothetical protein
VNNQLEGDASWTNLVTGRDRRYPKGWSGEAVDPGDRDPELALVEFEGPFRTPFHDGGPVEQEVV